MKQRYSRPRSRGAFQERRNDERLANRQYRLVCARESAIHGRGLFARVEIASGTPIIEYLGERISPRESLERCRANNWYIFALDNQTHLDGNVEWNLARLINHH